MTLDVHVGGVTTVVGPDGSVALRRKERAVVAAIAFDHPQPVSWQRIADLVWGVKRPATARGSIHNHVNRIRSTVSDLIVTTESGYRFCDGVTVDVVELEQLELRHGAESDIPDSVRRVLDRMSSDGPFVELAESGGVDARRRRLHVLRSTGEVRRLETEMQRGRHGPAVALAEQLVGDDPYDEHRWWLLAIALAHVGQRRASLDAIARARQVLSEVGLRPGEGLVQLERSILDDDVAIESFVGEGGSRTAAPVGIEHLLDVLWSSVQSPPGGRAVLLSGPAGGGKSTALRSLAARARGAGRRVLVVGCDPEPAVPLQPIVDLFEQIAAVDANVLRAAPDARALAVLSPRVVAVIGEPDAVVDRHRIIGAVRSVLGAMTDTLVIVEDVHWAPPRTVEALAAVAETPRAGGSHAVLMSARLEPGDPLPAVPADQVSLSPWSPQNVEEWLTPMEQDPARRWEAVTWLHRQSGGIPMFVRELALHLVGERVIGDAAHGPFVPPPTVPTAIATALAVRVSRPSRPGRTALEAAAILGTDFREDELVRVLGDRAGGVAEIRERGMLVPSAHHHERLGFEHGLLWRVVLDRLAPVARAELHDVALGVRDPDAPVMELARHALGAAILDRRRAIDMAIEAGAEALRRSARADAAEWWLAAAALLDPAGPDAATWCRLQTDAGRQLLDAGDVRAIDILFGAISHAEQRGDWLAASRAAVAVCRLGPTSQSGTRHDEAAQTCRRLLGHLEDPAARASLGAAATMVHSMSGEIDLARELYEHALADAETAASDDTWADVLPSAYQSLAAPDDLDRREQLADRLFAVAARLQRPDTQWSALHLQYSNRIQRGDVSARETADRLDALAPKVREQSRDWEMHYVRASVHQLDDDLDVCERVITESLTYADTIASSRVAAVYGAQMLSVRFAQRRLSELVDTIAHLADTQPGVGAWRGALALAAAQAGRLDLARESFDRAMAGDAAALDRDQTYSAALLVLGEAAIELDDAGRAADVDRLLAPLAARWSWAGSCTFGPIDTTLAGIALVAARPTDARRSARSAHDSCVRMRAPGFAALAERRLVAATRVLSC